MALSLRNSKVKRLLRQPQLIFNFFYFQNTYIEIIMKYNYLIFRILSIGILLYLIIRFFKNGQWSHIEYFLLAFGLLLGSIEVIKQYIKPL